MFTILLAARRRGASHRRTARQHDVPALAPVPCRLPLWMVLALGPHDGVNLCGQICCAIAIAAFNPTAVSPSRSAPVSSATSRLNSRGKTHSH